MEQVGGKCVLDSSCVLYLDAANPKSYGIYNLLLNTNDFTGTFNIAGWTFTPNAIANPVDGAIDADSFIQSTNSAQRLITKNFTALPFQTYTYTTYYKYNGQTTVSINASDGLSGLGVDFNLVNGTTSNPLVSKITDAGNGWWRCSVIRTMGATVGGAFFGLSSSGVFTGDGVSGFYLWGDMVHEGSVLKPIQFIGSTRPTQWTDLSGYGNHATLVNSPTPSIKNGGALYFDTTALQRATVNSNISLDNPQNITLIAWFSLGNTNTAYNSFFKIWTGFGSSYGCSLGGNGVILWYTNLANNNSSTNPSRTNNDLPVCLAFVYNGSNMTFYQDGVRRTIVTQTGNLILNSGTLGLVGANASTGDGTFGGWMNQMQIYNRALTAAEIKQNYDAFSNRYKK